MAVAGDTLESIALALAESVNADTTGSLAARTAGVALIIVNTAGNTVSTSFSVSPKATPVTPDPVPSYAHDVVLSGTPVAGDTWSVTVSSNDGSGLVSSSHAYIVRATVALAEVAAGLAAAINAGAQDGLTALAVGARLVVVSHAGTAFTAGFAVLPDGVLAAACRFMANRHDRLNVNGMESIRYRRGIKLITH